MNYMTHLSLFCKYHNTDPDSLIQLKSEQIKTMVLNYVIHLKKVANQSSGKARRGVISVNSIRTYLSGVQVLPTLYQRRKDETATRRR
jgi:hypothetical protein